ncbi:MAG: alkene reductase [Proteobacteria bacterium]|nr:alkene reductase [Pseudomonadota bacterium]MBU4328460.1 alkene reductase [Pseudomonadota bacterium]
MAMSTLFDSLQLGDLTLNNRIVMAPLTRMRSKQPGNIPHALNAEYYAQRSSAGLIISEASQITPHGQGYPATPGIYSAEQVAGWKLVTDAVHEKGGMIFLQLWHVGRISHSSFHPAEGLPVAPSAVQPAGMTMTADWQQVSFETPRELELNEIPGLIADYKKAAENAKAAGFDGVEVHGANGYLLDQFLQDGSNKRKDAYGGTIENRARLLLEVVDAVTQVWNTKRVGVRLSPYGTFNDMSDSDPIKLFTYVLEQLSVRRMGYAHLIEPRATGAGGGDAVYEDAPSTSQLFRKFFKGVFISAGGYNRENAINAVKSGLVDAVAFGRIFIANPDLPERLKLNAPLNKYNRATFYGGDAVGYTDYLALE